jgi:hypothetical protein
VRQIYYRLVGAYGFPKTEEFYAKLCHHLTNARRAGFVPFNAIRDDGVTTIRMEHFENEDAFRLAMRRKAEGYRRNMLARQRVHVEVWCEASGMIVQLAKVAHRYSVPVYSSSGFDSLTAKKDLADRICEIGKPTVILHLGDYDPSGESVFKAVAEDVAAFVDADRPHGFVNVNFRRIALTAEQVKSFNLPTSPAKATDTRSKSWVGETCQLEALAPDQIAALLDEALDGLLDTKTFNEDFRLEREERERLTRLLLTGPTS